MIESMSDRTYSFKEIASLTNVKPYVLRFWETEFDEINPNVDSLGEKIYRDHDIKAIEKIKTLLFKDKLSIPEAKLKFYEVEVPLKEHTSSLASDDSFKREPSFVSQTITPIQTLHLIKEKIQTIKEKKGWN